MKIQEHSFSKNVCGCSLPDCMLTTKIMNSESLTSKAALVFSGLIILINVSASPTTRYVSASQTTNFRPECESLFSWIRDPGDCSHFWRCVWGIPYEMPRCSEGQVLNDVHYVCVLKGSFYDNCDNQPIATPERVGHPYPKQQDIRIADNRTSVPDTTGHPYQTFLQTTPQATPTTGWPLAPPSPLTSLSWMISKCSSKSAAAFPHPQQCQAYYKCRHPTAGLGLGAELHLEQCPDGTMFDAGRMECQDFWTVDCGSRTRPAHLSNPHRTELNASCTDKPDGPQAVSQGLWSPVYVLCTRGAILNYSQCGLDETLGVPQVFSPEAGKCLSLYQVPPAHGGLEPNCTARTDGFYPDDNGRPDLYYACQGQKVVLTARCSDRNVFDAKFSFCRLPYL